MALVFIAGPSGSGKTTAGNILADDFGWFHFDCEALHMSADAEEFADFLEHPEHFIPTGGDVVVTWGFIPQFAATVRKIVKMGFVPIWLTGEKYLLDQSIAERDAAPPPDPDYYNKALKSEELLGPCMTLQAFLEDGTRRPIAQLIHHSVSGAGADPSPPSTPTTDVRSAECAITAAMECPVTDTLDV